MSNELVEAALSDAKPSGNGWLRVICPLCPIRTGSEDKRRGLGIHSTSGYWHCFRCGARGKIKNISDEIQRTSERDKEEISTVDFPESFVFLSDIHSRSYKYQDAFRYLYSRNIGTDLINDASLGACLTGKHRHRVVVPITLPGSNVLIGWSARSYKPNAFIPYLYPEGMDRARILYNHDALLVETDEPVLVVEGVFDVLALWPHAVALLGKHSEEQTEALIQAKRPVVVVLDGDAWQEGWTLAARLRFEGKLAGHIHLPPKVDPDEIIYEDLRMAAYDSLVEDL